MIRVSPTGLFASAVLLAVAFPCCAVESIDAVWLQSAGPTVLEPGDANVSIDASLQALQLAQRQVGDGSESLLGPLRDVAYALARAGLHREAIPYLERAVAIERAHHGVFDLRQLELLKQLATSLTAVGREADAQERMLYVVRAAEQIYGSPDVRVVPAYCELGRWFAEVGKFRESRMAYQVALNIVAATPANDSVAAVEPLLGSAATFMRQMSDPDVRPRNRLPIVYKGVNIPASEGDPRELADATEHSLQEALRILEGSSRTPTRQLIDTLVQTGDWFQIGKSPARALPYYQRAWRLIEAEPDQATSASRLDAPVRVYYPAPLVASLKPSFPVVETELRYVQVEFNVEADGSVSDARIVEHDTLDQYAKDVLQAIGEARFRPKFVDGHPVATRAVTYRQVLKLNKPLR